MIWRYRLMNLHAFTKQAKLVLRYAQDLTNGRSQYQLGTEYLLAGMMQEPSGVAGKVLRESSVSPDLVFRMANELSMTVTDTQRETGDFFTQEAKEILEAAVALSRKYGAEKAGTDHMLLAMLEKTDCCASRILTTMGVNIAKLYVHVLDSMGMEEEYTKEKVRALQAGRKSESREDSLLEQYARDLTRQAAADELDPLIGREAELRRVIQILSRRGKNNPCLIGEPGVGKTAIVEGLAQCIARGNVPEHLQNKRIMVLDVSGMVAGTKYRGEFEERMKNIIQEVQESQDVILFIDELHTIIGAGGAEGSLDAANIMKPALSRGRIRVIGATTVQEYRKHIEKDAALERRFQSVTVEEPDVEQTVRILEGLKNRYETHHHVIITDDGIRAAAELSSRYISDRFLPDKAIDLMDEAASKVHLRGLELDGKTDEEKDRITEQYQLLEDAIIKKDFERAKNLRSELKELQNSYEEMQQKKHRNMTGRRMKIGENEVADVVSEWTHIPVKRLTENESLRLKRMETSLHKRVIAQDEAISAVSKAVRRGRVGLKDPSRPIGSFLFLGPTGVGKTEVSKALACEVFGTEDSMIRVDMSEYMEKHSVSKLIGSPPGYVGYEEGGQLSEQVRRRPYSVILFDEIEKAHPDVFNILLQVLDDGHITDAQGRKVDFKNTIIIMTSNAGAQSIIEPKKLGFAAGESKEADYNRMKSNVMEEVRRIFKPEFLNRIDETIVFHALTKEHMKDIVSIMTKDLQERCEKQMGIRLRIQDSVRSYIVEKAYDPKYGARPLRRMIQTRLEDSLADEILAGTIKRGDTVHVRVSNDEISFRVKES